MYKKHPDQSAYNNHRTDMSKQLRRQNTTRDITKLVKTFITPIYFRFQNMTYIKLDGLAMGAPTSSVLSEFYLQYLESHKIYSLLLIPKVEGYFR